MPRRRKKAVKTQVLEELRDLGKRLRALREKRGLSQHELADLIGIHMSQLGRIERGVSTPSAETVHAAAHAHALGATTDALLRGVHAREQVLATGNVRLFECFRALEALGRGDQETAINLIDAVVARGKLRQAIAG